MGFFDKILNRGANMLGDAVKDAVRSSVNLAVGSNSGNTGSNSGSNGGNAGSNAGSNSGSTTSGNYTAGTGKKDNRKFDDKLKAVFEELSGYEIVKDVSVDVVEAIACREIYSRNGKKSPSSVSYGIKKDGDYVLFIRWWTDYNTYNRSANREVKKYCDGHNIAMLDFFDYLPNEYDYMLERIKGNIK